MSGLLIVTGASAGIGAATARMSVFSGWQRVVVHYGKDLNGANATASVIESMGGQAYVMPADLSKPKQIEKMFAKLRDLKPGRIGLVNNAGIAAPKAGIADLTPERVAQVFGVNTMGAIEVARQSVLLMREWQKGGAIVNVSSAASRLGSAGEYVDYAASKGALDTFTLGLAQELGPEGIRVNAIRPGLIDTEIHEKNGQPGRAQELGAQSPLGRAGNVDECAEAILWLLSERASYSTGSVLDVSGGR